MNSNDNLIRKASQSNKAILSVDILQYPSISRRTISNDLKKKTLTPYEVHQKHNENKKNLIKKCSLKTQFQFNLEKSKINSEMQSVEPGDKYIRSERLSVYKTTILKNPSNLNYFKQSTIQLRKSSVSKTTKEFQSIDISAFDGIRKRKSENFKFPRIQYM
jgi:hypothetical protein